MCCLETGGHVGDRSCRLNRDCHREREMERERERKKGLIAVTLFGPSLFFLDASLLVVDLEYRLGSGIADVIESRCLPSSEKERTFRIVSRLLTIASMRAYRCASVVKAYDFGIRFAISSAEEGSWGRQKSGSSLVMMSGGSRFCMVLRICFSKMINRRRIAVSPIDTLKNHIEWAWQTTLGHRTNIVQASILPRLSPKWFSTGLIPTT